MNKVYSKKEMKAKAQEVFEQYPSEDKVFAREDGNIFFNENLAALGRGKLKVYKFDKTETETIDANAIEVNAEMEEATVVETPKVDETLGKDGNNPENRKANTKK